MYSDDKKAGAGVSSTGIFWLVLLGAGAIFLKEVPWQGARPAGAEIKAYAISARQDVDARLWQDPIGAVGRALEEVRKRRKDSLPDNSKTTSLEVEGPGTVNPHTPEAVAKEVERRLCAQRDILLVGVMVAGGPYPEWAEFRRRARYAVLAGLSGTAFAPEDELHLGYFLTGDAQEAANPLPEFIAYEWMKPTEADVAATGRQTSETSESASKQDVLILWLDEDRIGRRMLEQISRISGLFPRRCPNGDGKATSSYARFAVLGPSTTGPLQDLIASRADFAQQEPRRQAHEAARHAEMMPVSFYAYGSTASDQRLLADQRLADGQSSVHSFLRDAPSPVTLFRTIGSDDRLAGFLASELARRNVRPSKNECPSEADRDRLTKVSKWQHVVLIAERDSFYGRSLSRSVAQALGGVAPCAKGGDDEYGSWIHSYSYLGGLDGQLPSGQPSDAGSLRKEESSTDAKTRDPKRIERPEGQGQFDYLRRLSDQVANLDEGLRLRREGSIRAVGVLGSDVYDKLVILQAIRAQFPNAIVFTTDMDARLLHPQQLEWTHNAIVASNFGLQLNDRLQQDVAPFRDGYQTSLYLSTMLAINHARKMARDRLPECDHITSLNESSCLGITQDLIDGWLASPRVFEIGRKSAFDFSKDSTGSLRDCSPMNLAGCAYVHAPSSPMYPRPAARWFQLATILVIGAVGLAGLFDGTWARLSERVSNRRAEGGPGRRKHIYMTRAAFATLALLLLCAFFAEAIWRDLAGLLTEAGDGEPIAWSLGVSTWPTEFLRAIALVLSVYFIVRGWRALNRNLDDISSNFLWQPERRELIRQLRAETQSWTPLERLLRLFSFRLVERAGGGVDPKTGLPPNAEQFWQKYTYQGRGSARALRIAFITLVYFLAGYLIIEALGPPVPPYRGSLLIRLDPWLTTAAVFAMLLLIFFVVDATVLGYQLVSGLRRKVPPKRGKEPAVAAAQASELRWPEGTLAHFGRKLQLEPRFLDEWITMHFVARRTDAVARLVYYPFIVISIMILARSSVFDNWSTSAGLAIVITGSLLIVIVCAISLRWAAERLRRSAIWRLSNAKIQLNGRRRWTSHRGAARSHDQPDPDI